jgi:mRNA interferase MazF
LDLVARGEVWLTKLDPTVGAEIQKTRPVVVVSPDDINRHLRLATVAPLTSGSRLTRFRVATAFQGKDGLLLLDQLRSVDHARFVRRLGTIDQQTLHHALAVLRDLFAE